MYSYSNVYNFMNKIKRTTASVIVLLQMVPNMPRIPITEYTNRRLVEDSVSWSMDVPRGRDPTVIWSMAGRIPAENSFSLYFSIKASMKYPIDMHCRERKLNRQMQYTRI